MTGSRSSVSTAASPSALMSTRATCQPFSASIRAVTRPIPAGPPAPVMTAVRCSGRRPGPVVDASRTSWVLLLQVRLDHATTVARMSRMYARFLAITVIASLP